MPKDFNNWNITKKKIDAFDNKVFFHSREIWWSSLGVNIGSEQDGKNNQFERPVLILRKFNNSLFLAVPMTSNLKTGRYYFSIESKGNKKSNAILSQVRVLDSKRLLRKITTISKKQFEILTKNIISIILNKTDLPN